MKKYLIGLAIAAFLALILIPLQAGAVVCKASQGCTNFDSATSTDVGKALVVSSSDPNFKWKMATVITAETDPIWSAFLLNPVFTNLTSTNLFVTNTRFVSATTTNLNFTNGTGTNLSVTSLTSTNAFFTTLNLINLIATNLTSTNFFATSSRVINSVTTNATTTNLLATNINFTNASGTSVTGTNGYFYQLAVGGDIGTAQFKITTPPGLVDAFQITDRTNYTFDAGYDSVNGGAFFGGLAGTPMSLWANGAMVIRLTNGGRVGVGTTAPTAKLSVAGDFDVSATTTLNATTTINGPLGFATASGTSITSTNAFFTNLRATTLNLTNLVATNVTTTNLNASAITFTTASGTSITSTNAFFTNLNASIVSLTSLTAASLTSTNGYIPTLVFVSATGTNFFATNTRFVNVTTTNIQVAGTFKDSNGSSGNVGDLITSNGTSTSWYTGGGSCNPYYQTDCTLVDQASWFVVSGGTGCPEGAMIYKDDSSYTCTPNMVYDYFTYATPRVTYNADISFLNATGTTGYFSSYVSSTNGYFTNLFATNLTLANNLTINNLIVNSTATIGSTTIATTTGIITNNLIIKYNRPGQSQVLNSIPWEPDNIVNSLAVANTLAFYSDDITRVLICGTAAGGTLSLKNNNLTPANTLNSAFYDSAGTLQTITATSLFGAGFAMKGCITTNGYHWVLATSSTAPTKVVMKVATSSYSVDLSNPAVWRTSTWTTATPSTSVIGLAGVSLDLGGANIDTMQIISSSNKLVPATFNGATASITPDNSIPCTPSGSMTISNTRANRTGYYIGQSSAPFVQKYNTICAQEVYNGSWGGSAPATTGPDLFALKCSIYSLAGTLNFKVWGFSGC